MTSRLQEMLIKQYTWLVENPTHCNIQFNLQYYQLVELSPERLEEEIKKCPKTSHTNCLPHLCAKAHLKLASEIKSEITIQCFYSDKKLMVYTTSEPKPNHLNLYRNALLRMGHSEEYAKQFYTCNPAIDFYFIKDYSMYCIILRVERNGGRRGRLTWISTDNTLSREEVRALAEKHRDVIELFKFGAPNYSILD